MKRLAIPLSLAFILAACGTEDGLSSEEPAEEPQVGSAEEPVSSEEPTAEVDREIIASLEQTAEPVERKKAAEAVKEMPEFKGGLLGEPTDELAEDMAVQSIEGPVVTEAVYSVYGGHESFQKEGVLFYENQTQGADQPGIWIGIKNPDERVDELVSILQEKVDAGEILAEPIYIYKSPHTQAQLNELTDQVAQALRKMADTHPKPDAVSFSASTDTITGVIEVSHNFLTDEQIGKLKSMFPDREVNVEQSGTMVPAPGEPTVVYPEPATVTVPSDEGDYLVDVEEGKFLAVDATAQDFSENGGQDEFYSAIWFDFPKAAEQLEVGQRVKIEASGPIMESYPGQGTAVFVKVLPAYQPEGAHLTEFEVVKQALEDTGGEDTFEVPAIQSVAYDAYADNWTVVLQIGEEEVSKTIQDE